MRTGLAYFKAILFLGGISALISSFHGQGPALTRVSRDRIDTHLRIIQAQRAAITCLRQGSSVEECEARLDDDCEGTDLDQCHGEFEKEESWRPSVSLNSNPI